MCDALLAEGMKDRSDALRLAEPVADEVRQQADQPDDQDSGIVRQPLLEGELDVVLEAAFAEADAVLTTTDQRRSARRRGKGRERGKATHS